MNRLVFTNPAMLWGLLAASLPVIIHLINRHRARRHPFAAIDFLLRVQRRSARRILLRQILLLCARTLLIICLVVAAAGPLLQPRQVIAVHGPVCTMVIIDRSFSMRARAGDSTRYDLARDRARAFVRGMAPGDKTCLIAAGLKTEVIVEPCTDSRGALLDALDGITKEWGSSNLVEALEIGAARFLDAPEPNHRILLFSDAAGHAFSGSPRWPSGTQPPEIVLDNAWGDDSRENHAVTSVEQTTRGRYLEIRAGFAAYAEAGEEGLPAEIRLGGATLARGFVDLKANQTVSKIFNIQVPKTPRNLGRILLAPDALAEDDWRIFYVSGRRLVHALLVNGDMRPVLHQDELFYLEHAMAPAGEDTSGIAFTTITPDRFDPGSLDNVEVVFLANVRELTPNVSLALRRFVASGGGLFIAMGDQVDVDRANAVLDDLLPRPLRDVVALGPADADGIYRQGIAFSDISRDHPVLKLFTGGEAQGLQAVRTWRAAVVEPGQTGRESNILLRYQNGSPALLEAGYQNGRVMLLTATLDRDWTSWPARASFLPFLQRITAYLAGRLSELPPPEVPVSRPVIIPLLENADGVRITRPDKQVVELSPGEAGAGTAVFADTTAPGFYAVEQTAAGTKLADRTIPGFIVHPPPEESNLTPISENRLQSLLGESTRLTLAGTDDESTRSRSMIFLLLALALVLCEAFLIRR
jgi:urease beta subunit